MKWKNKLEVKKKKKGGEVKKKLEKWKKKLEVKIYAESKKKLKVKKKKVGSKEKVGEVKKKS